MRIRPSQKFFEIDLSPAAASDTSISHIFRWERFISLNFWTVLPKEVGALLSLTSTQRNGRWCRGQNSGQKVVPWWTKNAVCVHVVADAVMHSLGLRSYKAFSQGECVGFVSTYVCFKTFWICFVHGNATRRSFFWTNSWTKMYGQVSSHEQWLLDLQASRLNVSSLFPYWKKDHWTIP